MAFILGGIITAHGAEQEWPGVCFQGYKELLGYLSSLASAELVNWVLWLQIKTLKAFLSKLNSCAKKNDLDANLSGAQKHLEYFERS